MSWKTAFVLTRYSNRLPRYDSLKHKILTLHSFLNDARNSRNRCGLHFFLETCTSLVVVVIVVIIVVVAAATVVKKSCRVVCHWSAHARRSWGRSRECASESCECTREINIAECLKLRISLQDDISTVKHRIEMKQKAFEMV